MGSLDVYIRDLVIRKKIFFLTLSLTLTLSTVISAALYDAASGRLFSALQFRLKHEAETAALLFDGDKLDRVRTEADRAGEAWKTIAGQLAAVRAANKLRDAYVMRKSTTAGHAEFVVDPSTESPTEIGEDYDA